MSEKKIDRIELQGGIAHLPEEFREVAEKANQAGLEGWKYVDADYGAEVPSDRASRDWAEGKGPWPWISRVQIIYEIQRPRTSEREGAVYVEDLEREIAGLRSALQESVKLQAHYAKLLNMHDGGERMIFESAEEWMARLKKLAIERGAL